MSSSRWFQTCNSLENGFSCTCAAGYGGDRCQDDPDNCLGSPCMNGGGCQDLENSFTCLCQAGFTGNVCQTSEDICVASPCANGATCRETAPRRRICDCPPGFEGDDCSVNLGTVSSLLYIPAMYRINLVCYRLKTNYMYNRVF